MDELEKRVQQFNSLSLPGQPMAMHMGTSYLVNDLWREVKRLRAEHSVQRTVCPNCYGEKYTESLDGARFDCEVCGGTGNSR